MWQAACRCCVDSLEAFVHSFPPSWVGKYLCYAPMRAAGGLSLAMLRHQRYSGLVMIVHSRPYYPASLSARFNPIQYRCRKPRTDGAHVSGKSQRREPLASLRAGSNAVWRIYTSRVVMVCRTDRGLTSRELELRLGSPDNDHSVSQCHLLTTLTLRRATSKHRETIQKQFDAI